MTTIDGQYYAVKTANGDLLVGRKSKTNGLYENRTKAVSQISRERNRIEISIRNAEQMIERYSHPAYNAALGNEAYLRNLHVSKERLIQRLQDISLYEVVVVKIVEV